MRVYAWNVSTCAARPRQRSARAQRHAPRAAALAAHAPATGCACRSRPSCPGAARAAPRTRRSRSGARSDAGRRQAQARRTRRRPHRRSPRSARLQLLAQAAVGAQILLVLRNVLFAHLLRRRGRQQRQRVAARARRGGGCRVLRCIRLVRRRGVRQPEDTSAAGACGAGATRAGGPRAAAKAHQAALLADAHGRPQLGRLGRGQQRLRRLALGRLPLPVRLRYLGPAAARHGGRESASTGRQRLHAATRLGAPARVARLAQVRRRDLAPRLHAHGGARARRAGRELRGRCARVAVAIGDCAVRCALRRSACQPSALRHRHRWCAPRAPQRTAARGVGARCGRRTPRRALARCRVSAGRLRRSLRSAARPRGGLLPAPRAQRQRGDAAAQQHCTARRAGTLMRQCPAA
jgi:hypothetical protein